MSVQIVRSTPQRAPEPVSGRSSGSGADFPAMMDSALGRPAAPRASAGEGGREARSVGERDARASKRGAARSEEDRARDDGGAGSYAVGRSAPAAPTRRSAARRADDGSQDTSRVDPSTVSADSEEAERVASSSASVSELALLARGGMEQAAVDAEASGTVPASAESGDEGTGRSGSQSAGARPGAGASVGGPSMPAWQGAVPGAAVESDTGARAAEAATTSRGSEAGEPGFPAPVADAFASDRTARPRIESAPESQTPASDPRPSASESLASAQTDTRPPSGGVQGDAAGRALRAVDGKGHPAAARPSVEAVEAARPTSPRTAEVDSLAASAPDAPAVASADAGAALESSVAARGGEAASVRAEGLVPSAVLRAPDASAAAGEGGRALPAAAPDSIAIQTEWLATRGGGTARLVLHPPELGEIAIRVTVRQQSVDVVMVAHTALAQQAADDQSERLSQAFASRDLRLEHFEVRRGDPSDASPSGEFGSSDAGARERERAGDGAFAGRSGPAGQGGRQGFGEAEASASPPPRIVSSGRAAGIDLRI